MSGMMSQRPDQGSSPPPSPVAPSQAAGILRARIVIISGSGVTGLFEYSGTPALGNPPIAYAAAPGVTHDPFGNVLPATGGGFVTVSSTQFANLLGFALQFGGTGLTSDALVALASSGGGISLASATTAAAPEQGTLGINPGTSPADPLATLNALLRLTSGLAANELLGLDVAGDTHDRLAIDSNGQHSWGTGALAADTTLARTSAGVLTIGSTLIVGTVLTNLLQLTEQAVPAATTSVQMIGNTSGHAEVVSDTTHGDGNNYDIERQTIISTATTINSAVSRVNVFSRHLGVGTYKIRIWLVTQNTTAADAAAWSFALVGGLTLAASGNLVDFESKTTGTAVVGYAASSTVTTTFNGQGVGGNQQLLVQATVVVTAAGSLTFGGLELVGGNTITVSAGGQMDIYPVVAT